MVNRISPIARETRLILKFRLSVYNVCEVDKMKNRYFILYLTITYFGNEHDIKRYNRDLEDKPLIKISICSMCTGEGNDRMQLISGCL